MYDRAAESGYTASRIVDAWVRVLAIRQLLADSAKRVSYTQNQSSESMSDVFRNLKALLELWETEFQQARAEIMGPPLVWGKPRGKPQRIEEVPDDGYVKRVVTRRKWTP